ncbi:MAG: RNA polymerase sigma factor, partial [Anaerolineales bacterium]
VSPWLYRTAQNLLIDHYRKQNHRNHLPLNEEVAEKSMLPPEIVDQKISETYIRKALKTLTPEQRTVIVLKYLEGKSNQEVAEIMHKSVGAIKSLQNRALNALRRMLSEVMEG